MEREFETFVEKARKIIADAPRYALKRDKVALLNKRFRLGKKECNVLLKKIGGLNKC